MTKRIINGRYEIVKVIGSGSMGTVYLCRHLEMPGLMVVVKVLFAEVANDEVASSRFKNEIVASYEVSHPNVVRAYEYLRDGEFVAFTMEYVDGGSLADKIGESKTIPLADIVRILKQICSGLQAIHDARIVHRNFKPENILLTSNGDVKISDFGISRTATGPKLTEHGSVVGTIDYVSPEYLERGEIDLRADIYAVGVIAYELIIGEAPFKGASLIETMTKRLKESPIAPDKLRDDCPQRLSDWVMKALQRDPELRYQAAKEMEKDLDQIVSQELLH